MGKVKSDMRVGVLEPRSAILVAGLQNLAVRL